MPLLNYTTKIDIFTTLGQIQGMLVKHGAKKILQEYDSAGHVEAVSACKRLDCQRKSMQYRRCY